MNRNNIDPVREQSLLLRRRLVVAVVARIRLHRRLGERTQGGSVVIVAGIKKGGGKKSRRQSKRQLDNLTKTVDFLKNQINCGYVSDVSRNLYNQNACVSPSQHLSREITESPVSVPLFDFNLETKLKEPSVPVTSSRDLETLTKIQLFDDVNWSELRYAETQKLYNQSPGFVNLETNEEIKAYDSQRQYVHAEKAYAAISLAIIKQKQALQNCFNDLIHWARDEDLTADTLSNKISSLFSEGDFHKISTDILQLVCGHRAEIIQMRRDGIFRHVKDPLMKSTLRKISPSCYNLFNAEKFTAAIEKAGGVRKCFFPLNKKGVFGTSSQGDPKKASSCPSQGKPQQPLPSQGNTWPSQAHNHGHDHNYNETRLPPSQGVYNHCCPSQGPANRRPFRAGNTGNKDSFQSQQQHSHANQRSDEHFNRKRPANNASRYQGQKRKRF